MVCSVAAEPSIRNSYNGEPRTHRDLELNASWVAAQGGDAVKFLVQLRADRSIPTTGEPDLVREVLDVCREIIADCNPQGCPPLSRILSTSLRRTASASRGKMQSSAPPAHSTSSTLTSSSGSIPARQRPVGGWRTPCTALGCARRPESPSSSSVTSSRSHSTKVEPGFIAGRSIWREALPLNGMERQRFLDSVARPRLDDLVAVANERARPWTDATR